MIFKNVVPILYSSNVSKSLAYYVDVLGFENRWDWGHPPTFGGVNKNSVGIFFCEKGQGHPGTWLSVGIDNVDEYYETIKAKAANVISAPETLEWGMREMLVEDLDGHRIRFSQSASVPDRQHSAALLPETIRIINRVPTTSEFQRLVSAVGWNEYSNPELTENLLAAVVFAAVAEDSVKKEVIGCALLLGDHASFYYIKDVMVHPDWKAKRVGTALMQELTDWLEINAADQALVGLFTGQNLESFYRQFGFSPAFGMHRRIRRTQKGV